MLRRFASAAVLSAALLVCSAYASETTGDVRAALAAMHAKDQQGRARISAAMKEYASDSPEVDALWQQQERIDRENVERLQAIVDASGWPKRSEVGGKAATTAFLVLQHAEHEAQVRLLPLVRAAVAAGEAQPSHLALLEDRVLMRSGRKQRYGSQVVSAGEGKGLAFHPIEDEANVNRRRAAVGLEPIAEYAKQFGIEYAGAKGEAE